MWYNLIKYIKQCNRKCIRKFNSELEPSFVALNWPPNKKNNPQIPVHANIVSSPTKNLDQICHLEPPRAQLLDLHDQMMMMISCCFR